MPPSVEFVSLVNSCAGWVDFDAPTSGSSLGTGVLPFSDPFDRRAWWTWPTEQAQRPAEARCRWRSWSPFRQDGGADGKEWGVRRAENACNSG